MQHRQHLGHIRALDGLRGFALLLVFGYHALSRELVSTSLAGTLAKKIALTGWVGVDLFFVLSGFLITSILLDARTAGNYLRVFYARRALRIFPLYYLVLAASLLLMPDHFGWKAQIFYWFNLSNLVTAFHPLLIPYLAHFWSLAIEEQFYLVWPALVLLLRPRALAALCGGVLVAVFAARNLPAILALNQRFPDFVYRFTPLRVDTLCAGALLAIVVRQRPDLLSRLPLRFLCLFSGALFLWVGFGRPYVTPAVVRVGYTSLILCFTSLIALAVRPASLTASLFANSFLRRTGRYSYALYLFHPFVINAVSFHLRGIHRTMQGIGLGGISPNLLIVFLVLIEFGLLFGLSALSWRFLEEPILAQKRRFRYRAAHEAVIPPPRVPNTSAAVR